MNHVSETSRKLALISEVMADGYNFLVMRELCQDWQAQADCGNQTAKDMMQTVETFYKLCKYVKTMPEG